MWDAWCDRESSYVLRNIDALVHDAKKHFRRRLSFVRSATERESARQQRVEGNTQGEDIYIFIVALSLYNLGSCPAPCK